MEARVGIDPQTWFKKAILIDGQGRTEGGHRRPRFEAALGQHEHHALEEERIASCLQISIMTVKTGGLVLILNSKAVLVHLNS